MRHTSTSTDCIVPRRRLLGASLTTLLGAALLGGSAAWAQAPDSIANALLHGTITASTGGLPGTGTFTQLFTVDTDYNVSITGSVPAPPADYTYEVVDDDSATITETGVTVALTFTDADSGTFVTTFTAGGTQSGTFELEPLTTDFGVPPLVNISTRCYINPDGLAIGGFVIAGDEPRSVLLRVVGPGLIPAGVTNALADPTITVFSGQTELETNDNWDDGGANTTAVEAAQTLTGAFALEADSADAALVMELAPGEYTIWAQGASETAEGEILVEVYYIE